MSMQCGPHYRQLTLPRKSYAGTSLVGGAQYRHLTLPRKSYAGTYQYCGTQCKLCIRFDIRVSVDNVFVLASMFYDAFYHCLS